MKKKKNNNNKKQKTWLCSQWKLPCLKTSSQNAPQVHNRWSHGDYHIHIKPTRVFFSFLTTFFATTHRAQTEPKKSWRRFGYVDGRHSEAKKNSTKNLIKATKGGKVQTPLSNFWKKLLVPRSTKACKKTQWRYYIAMATPMSKKHYIVQQY